MRHCNDPIPFRSARGRNTPANSKPPENPRERYEKEGRGGKKPILPCGTLMNLRCERKEERRGKKVVEQYRTDIKYKRVRNEKSRKEYKNRKEGKRKERSEQTNSLLHLLYLASVLPAHRAIQATNTPHISTTAIVGTVICNPRRLFSNFTFGGMSNRKRSSGIIPARGKAKIWYSVSTAMSARAVPAITDRDAGRGKCSKTKFP